VIEDLETRQLFAAAPVPLPVDPGSDTATAYDLGTFAKTKLATGDTIGAGDSTDVFKFTVASKSTFSASVKGVGKTGKLVKPTIALINAAGDTATAKKPTAAKQTLGPGTYYVRVTGLETGTTPYKLTIASKTYAGKKAATFTSDGGTGNNGGTTGGTITGNLTPASTQPGNFSDSYRFTATQSGTFELPATFASDVFWNAAPFDNANSSGPGGGGIGTGDGTLTVVIEAGNDYIFNVVAGQTATAYSVTLDNSFTNVHLVEGG
jgi:hypothetical protein